MIAQRRSVHDIIFTAFDFETTGLYPPGDRIVEIGAVRFTLAGQTSEFQTLVNPQMPIHAGASAVSGIYDHTVASAPVISKVLPEFLAFLQGTVLIAHNAMFDMGFLRAAIESTALTAAHNSLDNPILDTQVLAKHAFPGQKSYSLQNLVNMLGFPPNQAHRALDDSYMCMRLFTRVVDQLSFMGDLEIDELLKLR